MAPGPLAIGVDLGGTWLRLVALGPRGTVADRARVAAPTDLAAALRAEWRARGWTKRRVARLVVAARGVWTPAERAAVASRLRGLAGAVAAIPDVEAAHLGALGGGPGLLLLAGTGSIALGRTARGAWLRAGGLGPLLGDEGSAFWIGREWLRGEPLERARALARGPDAVARIAALAKGVVRRARRGGRREREVVGAAQDQLAALAGELLATLGPCDGSWGGALLGDAWFRAGVVARLGDRVRWREPARDAVLAAAREALAWSASGGPRTSRPSPRS